jgi:hypothetical protein
LLPLPKATQSLLNWRKNATQFKHKNAAISSFYIAAPVWIITVNPTRMVGPQTEHPGYHFPSLLCFRSE